MTHLGVSRAGRLSPQRSRQQGMSLIEVLVGVAIMMVIAIGIIPLFTRSMRQNREGANYTDLTNVARTTLEEYTRYDFNAPQLTIPVGSTDLVVQEYYNNASAQWLPYPPVSPATLPTNARFQRTITVQQYTAGDLTDDGELDDALDGGVTRDAVQIKAVRVVVRPMWSFESVFGRATPVQLEVLKAV